MKITDIELFIVGPRSTFIKVLTDEGITGWGEPIIPRRSETVVAAVHEMADWLVGRDPDQIEDIWQTFYRSSFFRGGPIIMAAIAGIDQALWDIKGKRYGLPVYQLLGGAVRDKMQVYAWIGGDTPEEMAANALQRVAQGYRAIKVHEGIINPHYIESFEVVDQAIAKIGAIRDAIGNGIGMGIDFHGHLHRGLAKVVAKELEPFHPLFLEEPVLPEHGDALREIANHTSTPIATGERLYSRWDFKQILHDGYVDIIQPDLSHAGGISEVKKIVGMAEAYDVAVAPHCPLGPIALMACLQIDAVTPHAFIQEEAIEIHDPSLDPLMGCLENPDIFGFKDGYVPLPQGPGLGIEINEDAVREAVKVGHRWRPPFCRAHDGTVAEW
jgi:galactonate dehydratase